MGFFMGSCFIPPMFCLGSLSMNGWNEQTLRTAASWKAFKEGKALFERGAVSVVKAGSSGWQGTVNAGKRPIRVSVTVKSANDLETRCSCPENQSSGELCAHAVATGLATLAPAADPVSRLASPHQPAAIPAFDLLLPPQWREALTRGKLSVTAKISSRSPLDAADHKLASWLAAERVTSAPSLHLHLDAARVSTFLDAIVGHPAIFTGKDPVVVTTGHRMHLDEALLENDQVRLTPAADDGAWNDVGGGFWQAGADFLKRAGSPLVPAASAGLLKSLARGESVSIPVRQLLANLESWQDWLAFPASCWLESLHFVPAEVSFDLELDGSLQHVDARLTVTYPEAAPIPPGLGEVPHLPRLTDSLCKVRNHGAERNAAEQLERAGFQIKSPAEGTWSLSGETAVLKFLSQTLPSLRQIWRIGEGSRFAKAHQQLAIVSPRIDILGSGEDWLGFDLKFQTDDGIEIPREEIQRLLRSGKTTGRVAGGRQTVISNDMANLIEPLFSELEIEQKNGRYESSSRSGEVILEIRNKIRSSLESNHSQDLFTFEKPATIRASMRPYQERGTAWMQDRLKRFGGALLADDMGLGKTLQTIALIENLLTSSMDDSGVVLVVATTSLLGNWRAEFGRFAPGRSVRILHGSGREKEQERLQPGEVALTSFGTLARDLAWHLRQDYRAVVVDEASLMRNPDTDHAKALSKLRTRHRIALTGTPVENGVRDLWSIFRFIQPGWLGGREEFRERYELALSSGEGAASVMERLKLKISPFILRRTKEQVAPELPSKLIIDEYCDLSSDQQAVYRDLLAEGRRQVEDLTDSNNSGAARMRVLTALLRLRQSCCDLALLGNERLNHLSIPRRSAKLERLLELLEEAVNGNHRVLIFSQFQKQLLEIEKCISERDWECLRLDGQTRNRQEMVEKFQDPQGPPVFLISLKAGGYGLNLTAADTVIHFDPWWNPAAEAQATDRAHRIGQARPVTVYRLLTRGTVEEQVVRLQARKRELAAAIDESGGGDAPGWSVRDLQAVITGG
jgi:superfamily II DNA or RNA helicase